MSVEMEVIRSSRFAWKPRRVTDGSWAWLRVVHVYEMLWIDRDTWVPSAQAPAVLMPKVVRREVFAAA